jgi:2,4-dienoyl-CoA reductase-like NADH-dependent reductase (Old Yellow Enzyme family)
LSTFKDHNIVPIDPFSYIKIRGKVFTNRIIKAATYEALCDLEGIPLKGLVDFHQKMARGGSGMSIVAYGAISAPGRSFPAQLICREKSIPMMTSVTNAIHSEGRLACIQLTHAGYFSDPALSELPLIHEQMSAQSIFNPAKFCFCREMSGEDRQQVCNDFVEAAKVAVRAGFDCLEIHCGHGYLLSQYLSPRLNSGKSLMERLAYPCLILRNIRNAIKDTAVLMVKMNLIDGMEGGISVQESCEIAKAFASCGVDIIALSGGLILENGLFMLRGEVPLSNMIAATLDPMKRLALQIFGPIVIPKLAYKEMFFREPALCVRSALHTWNSTTGMEVGHRVAVCMMGGVQDLDSLVKATQ